MKETTPKSEYIRISLTLPDSLDRVLQNVGNEARAQGGYKLPKTMIIRALVHLLMRLNVDVSGVKSEEELLDRFLEAARAYKGK